MPQRRPLLRLSRSRGYSLNQASARRICLADQPDSSPSASDSGDETINLPSSSVFSSYLIPAAPPFPPTKSQSSTALSTTKYKNKQARILPGSSPMQPDSEDESLLNNTTASLRTRLFRFTASRTTRGKLICTKPGEGAGETETEADEPPRHLPTARKIPASGPIVPPNTLEKFITPLMFESSRLLAIVPAVIGTLYNLYHFYYPPEMRLPDGRIPPERIDFFVSMLWSILTGYQCLSLATGLLTRWRVYYPPLAALIRLVALQAICWPATHLTLSVLEHERRPVLTWAVIATTTSISRSVQLWVTSNLWWDGREGKGDWNLLRGGAWGGRRWDWREVILKCVLPAGVVYFVMAWAEQLRREWTGC